MFQEIIKWILFVISGPLWRMGGWGTEGLYPNPLPWTGWRDMLIPVFFGLYWSLFLGNGLLGITSAITLSIIRVGYGPKSLFQVKLGLNDLCSRTLAGLLYGVIGLLPVVIYTHQGITYLLLIIALTLINFIVVYFNLRDVVADVLIGWVLALALLFFRI